MSEQKIKDIIDTAFTNMVYADSEEQVVSLYDAMISEIDANQASAIEAVYTETVSYTHLDVYKRQPLFSTETAPEFL